MRQPSHERGAILLLIAATVAIAIAVAFTSALARMAVGASRTTLTDQALAQAREALTAYATSRPIDAVVGPGYLPCPDRDDDGWAEPTCGSMSGDTGQWQRLGRLPWKTLGLPDLRDGVGERLWYAVSSKHKGLLNCAASAACLDMGPESAIGTITIRDTRGTVIHDGTLARAHEPRPGGAIAVVFAPGPALARWTGPGSPGVPQARTCEGGRCNAAGHCLTDPPTRTPKCDPVNYLDRSPGAAFADEDNATFVDRNDWPGRLANRDGFIQGPVIDPEGRPWVNDRLAVITYEDLMPRVMQRVGQEVASCLRDYGARREHRGRMPWASPLCRAHDPDATLRFADAPGVRFGRVPDTPFLATQGDGDLLPHWVQGREGCRIGDAAGATAGMTGRSWWNAWKTQVLYAIAPAYGPEVGSSPSCDRSSCLVTADGAGTDSPALHAFAVLVAGAPLRRGVALQSRVPPADLDARNWLEGTNAELRRLNPNPEAPQCPADPDRPNGRAAPPEALLAVVRGPDRNDVVVTGRAGGAP